MNNQLDDCGLFPDEAPKHGPLDENVVHRFTKAMSDPIGAAMSAEFHLQDVGLEDSFERSAASTVRKSSTVEILHGGKLRVERTATGERYSTIDAPPERQSTTAPTKTLSVLDRMFESHRLLAQKVQDARRRLGME